MEYLLIHIRNCYWIVVGTYMHAIMPSARFGGAESDTGRRCMHIGHYYNPIPILNVH